MVGKHEVVNKFEDVHKTTLSALQLPFDYLEENFDFNEVKNVAAYSIICS